MTFIYTRIYTLALLLEVDRETNRAKSVGRSRIASRESRNWVQVGWAEGSLDFVSVEEC